MEFYIVVLIFITCMIALALLIYYCQEYRFKSKYSFNEYQKDVSAIALAIGVPTYNTSQPSAYKSAGIISFTPTTQSHLSQPPPPGFMYNVPATEKLNVPPYPTAPSLSPPQPPVPPPPPLQGYPRSSLTSEDEMSDSGSSTSSKIYYAPNTTAYSIAKRMSLSANAQAMANRKSLSALPSHLGEYLLAKKLREIQRLKENARPESNGREEHRSASPAISVITNRSDRGNSRESNGIEMKNRRSMSPYIPLSVAAFHMRNKDSRSGSPYTPLRNDSPVLEKGNPSGDRNGDGKRSNKEYENARLEQKELAPPQRSENICYPKQNPIFKINDECPPYSCAEAPHQIPSPVPLRTVEEEE